MPRPAPGGTPSSQLGQLCAVEEPPSQKLHPLLRKRRLPCASSIPARRFQAGGPIENQYRTPKQRKNEPIRRQIYNRTTPREKGGLEGVNANDVNLPVLDNVPLPNPDTIEEFKTQTSLYDASSGRNGGGNVQVNLKSGTAHFHGDAYEFFRNNVLNSNDFFFNAATPQVPRPVLRQNQY